MARLQSKVSSGLAGEKGAAVVNTGDKPLVTPMGSMLLGHKPADAASVGGNPKGSTLARKDSGGRPEMPGSSPLAGHSDHPVGLSAQGNSPKRSPGKKTTFTNPAVMS